MNTGPLSLWIVVLVWAALVVLAVYYYRRTVPEIPTAARRVLLALRLVALSALALALAQPVFDWQSSRPVTPVWNVLVDYSTSMDRVDGPGPSRLAQALAIASDNAWRQVPGVKVERTYFASEAASDSAGLGREGTDLHAALSNLAEQAEAPAAVVVASDGAVNGARDPAASTWPFPVYSICLGDSVPGQDLAAVELSGPATAVAGDSVTMVLQATSEGAPTSAVVQFEAGEARESRTERFDGGGRRQEIAFVFRPDTAGLYRVQAEVAPGRDEVSAVNNRIETHVYVEPRRRRCLLLAQSPDWETAFLSRALSQNDRLEFEVRCRRLTGRLQRPWPQTLDSLLVFDAVIVTDMWASEWVPLQPAFTRFAREGGGLLFLLGPRAAESVWQPEQEELLGVQVQVNPPGTLGLDLPLRLAVAGSYHPVTGGTDTVAPLGDLSRPSGLIPVQLRPGAQRLIESAGPVSWPALAASASGQGRVLTSLGFPLWRIAFAPGAPATRDAYTQFWQRALAWLTTSTQASRLTVDATEQPLPLFTAPEFRAVLVDEAWRPDPHATVTAIVRDRDSNVVQTFELVPAGNGRYRGAGRPMEAGDYRFEILAQRDTLILASQSGPLVVSSVSREALLPSSRPANLDRLAAATGGKRLGSDTWRQELDGLPRKESAQTRYGTFRLWDHPLLLVLLVLLLAAEWILRRRYQML